MRLVPALLALLCAALAPAASPAPPLHPAAASDLPYDDGYMLLLLQHVDGPALLPQPDPWPFGYYESYDASGARPYADCLEALETKLERHYDRRELAPERDRPLLPPVHAVCTPISLYGGYRLLILPLLPGAALDGVLWSLEYVPVVDDCLLDARLLVARQADTRSALAARTPSLLPHFPSIQALCVPWPGSHPPV